MILITTSKGDIYLELDDEKTPQTTKNFRDYLKKGFYNNTIFHRVIDNFMIQGGGMTADMRQKPTDTTVKNEANVGSTNKRGTIAMARTSSPHSASSQFFINLQDNAFLNYKSDKPDEYGYCVFGHVVKGMDVVDAIGKVKTQNRMGHSDVPSDDVIIFKIAEVEEA